MPTTEVGLHMPTTEAGLFVYILTSKVRFICTTSDKLCMGGLCMDWPAVSCANDGAWLIDIAPRYNVGHGFC